MRIIVYLAGLLLVPSLGWAQNDAIAQVAERSGGGDMTLWKLVQAGGWAMVPLALMSVLAVMLILAYFVTLRRGAILSHNFMNTADVLLKKGDYPGLLSISSRHSEAIARVVQRTLDFAIKNPEAPMSSLREIAETEAASRAAAMQHRVIYLADIGVLSPMVGLFGTVVGIIKSFGGMAGEVKESARTVLLAAGVSEALIATASGLILGILAMACYAWFRGKAQRLISDLDIATTHILGLLAIRQQKKRPRERGEPAAAFDDDF